MNKPSTEKIVINGGCAAECRSYAREHFGDAYAVVCDGNTEPIARRAFPGDELIVFPAGSHATEQAADDCISRIKSDELCGLIACGSGSVHDIARYSAHDRKIPFVSFPTAASVDGFASGVAAMTWQKGNISVRAADRAVCRRRCIFLRAARAARLRRGRYRRKICLHLRLDIYIAAYKRDGRGRYIQVGK